MNDVESNPGPRSEPNEPIICMNKSNLFICTYNVQGLLNYGKHKRINAFLHKLPFKQNAIIHLQETHFKESNSAIPMASWSYTGNYT